jgi:hypothetical protein
MLDQSGNIGEQIHDALDVGESQEWHLVGVSDVLPERGVIHFWDTVRPQLWKVLEIACSTRTSENFTRGSSENTPPTGHLGE